jgi:hypothetical protein
MRRYQEDVLNLISSSYGVRILSGIALCFGILSLQSSASASPFGQGVFNANVPFGSQTSISIALGGDVNLSLTPSGSYFTGSGSTTATVTSTDVEGYYLYMYAPTSSSLVNGSYSIPASSNTSESSLSTNSWGYNTDGSSNYIGPTTTPTVISSATGPYESGNTTTIYYGLIADISKPAGSYTTNLAFTAVPWNQ